MNFAANPLNLMNLEFETALVDKRLEETRRRLSEKYGVAEAELGDFLLKNVMGQLYDNARCNELSPTKVMLCFTGLMHGLSMALKEINEQPKS